MSSPPPAINLPAGCKLALSTGYDSLNELSAAPLDPFAASKIRTVHPSAVVILLASQLGSIEVTGASVSSLYATLLARVSIRT